MYYYRLKSTQSLQPIRTQRIGGVQILKNKWKAVPHKLDLGPFSDSIEERFDLEGLSEDELKKMKKKELSQLMEDQGYTEIEGKTKTELIEMITNG